MAKSSSNYTPKMVARMHDVYVPTASQDARDAAVEQLAADMSQLGPNALVAG